MSTSSCKHDIEKRQADQREYVAELSELYNSSPKTESVGEICPVSLYTYFTFNFGERLALGGCWIEEA